MNFLTTDQQKLIEDLKKHVDIISEHFPSLKKSCGVVTSFYNLLTIIHLQQQVIEKCREQRNYLTQSIYRRGFGPRSYLDDVETHDEELQNIMRGTDNG